MEEKDPYEIIILEPETISFSRGSGGVLQAVINGSAHEEVVVYRTYPFLYTTEYISVRNPKGDELGIIRDIAELDEESRLELERELQYRYFLPRVNRIDSVKEKSDLW